MKNIITTFTFNSVLGSKMPVDAGFFAQESFGFAVKVGDVSVIP